MQSSWISLDGIFLGRNERIIVNYGIPFTVFLGKPPKSYFFIGPTTKAAKKENSPNILD